MGLSDLVKPRSALAAGLLLLLVPGCADKGEEPFRYAVYVENASEEGSSFLTREEAAVSYEKVCEVDPKSKYCPEARVRAERLRSISTSKGNDVTTAEKSITFLPGRGIENGPGLGDDESTFVTFVGGSKLEAAAVRGICPTFGTDACRLLRSKGRGSASPEWMAVSDGGKLVQLFHCGTDWRAGSVTPSKAYSEQQAVADLGDVPLAPVCKRGLGAVHLRGIGFDDPKELTAVQPSGMEEKSLSYRCVTVFPVKPNDGCPVFLGWNLDSQ